MGNVIEYIDEAPNRAIVYLLMMAVLTLSSVIVYLFKDKQKQELKNFDMLVRSIENLKDNTHALELLQDKVDVLLRKHG